MLRTGTDCGGPLEDPLPLPPPLTEDDEEDDKEPEEELDDDDDAVATDEMSSWVFSILVQLYNPISSLFHAQCNKTNIIS